MKQSTFGVRLEMSALGTLYSGQFTLSIQLIKTNYHICVQDMSNMLSHLVSRTFFSLLVMFNSFASEAFIVIGDVYIALFAIRSL